MPPAVPDPSQLRPAVASITRAADRLRQHAVRLDPATGPLSWQGSAARAYAGRSARLAASLRSTAARLDDASRLLDAHLRRVEAELAAALRVARAVEHDAEAAARLAASAPGRVLAGAEHAAGAAVGALSHLLP